MKYRTRTDAGRVLARFIRDLVGESSVLLGLPNGGIPVGIEIARELGIPFDLLFVSKITPKFNTEIGYGSVSESGEVNLNNNLIQRLNLSIEDVERDIAKTKKKIAARMNKYAREGGRCSIRNKQVVLVDDGIASGYTMINARDTVKERGAREIIIAVPTAPLENYNRIGDMVDHIICPDVRDTDMFAVADAYSSWYDISFESAILSTFMCTTRAFMALLPFLEP